jgi:O-antigen ligase
VALAVAFVVLAMMPQSPVDRMLHPVAGDVESANIRLQLWDAGLEMVRQHPVVGVGLGNFKPSVSRFFPVNADTEALLAHNTYMESLAEMGVPGLLAFLAIFGTTFVCLERTRRRARTAHEDFISQAANALQMGLFGFAFAIFFLSAEFLKLFWFSVFLGASLPQVLAASLAAAKARVSAVSEADSAGRQAGGSESRQEESAGGGTLVQPEPGVPSPENDLLYDPANLTSPVHAILTFPPRRKL